MTTVTYRPFVADNAPAVSELALRAWHATYRDIFTSDFIDDYVGRNYAPAQLAAAVPYVEAGEMFFHVAFDQGVLVRILPYRARTRRGEPVSDLTCIPYI